VREVHTARSKLPDPLDGGRAAASKIFHVVRGVSGQDDGALARLDDDGLVTGRMAGREQHGDAGQNFDVSFETLIPRARKMHPLDDVIRLGDRVVLGSLDVDRDAWEELVAAAMVEVQMRIDDRCDLAELGPRSKSHRPLQFELGRRLDDSCVNEDGLAAGGHSPGVNRDPGPLKENVGEVQDANLVPSRHLYVTEIRETARMARTAA
jgi:hypothetical protein